MNPINLDLIWFSVWKFKNLLNYNFTTLVPYYFWRNSYVDYSADDSQPNWENWEKAREKYRVFICRLVVNMLCIKIPNSGYLSSLPIRALEFLNLLQLYYSYDRLIQILHIFLLFTDNWIKYHSNLVNPSTVVVLKTRYVNPLQLSGVLGSTWAC